MSKTDMASIPRDLKDQKQQSIRNLLIKIAIVLKGKCRVDKRCKWGWETDLGELGKLPWGGAI